MSVEEIFVWPLAFPLGLGFGNLVEHFLTPDSIYVVQITRYLLNNKHKNNYSEGVDNCFEQR